jgi:hypothetical protein
MRPSLHSQRLVPLILLAVLAAAFLAVAAGRLGGGGGGTSAREVVDRAFATKTFKSGKLAATMSVSFEGASKPQPGRFGIALEGAFENDGGASKSDFDMSFNGLARPLGFGFVSTGEEAFLELGNRAYRVPRSQLDRLKQQNARQKQSFAGLGALGVNPREWLVDPTSRGTATVGGVETNHVAARVDTAKLVADFVALGKVSGQSNGGTLSATDRRRLEQSLENATVDVYAAKSDGTLRKLSGKAGIAVPAGGGAIRFAGNGTLSFDMEFSDVNEPQKITAPNHARPFEQFQADASGRFLSAFSGAGSGSAGPNGSPGGSAAGGAKPAPAPTVPGPGQAYLDCVQKARTNADMQQCAPLLG